MESVLPDLVNSLQASSIVLEEEVEYRYPAALAQLASGRTVDSLCLNYSDGLSYHFAALG